MLLPFLIHLIGLFSVLAQTRALVGHQKNPLWFLQQDFYRLISLLGTH